VSLNHCYFWDNIQQTSKEANWYYNTDFSGLLLPSFSEVSEVSDDGKSDIAGTGYHPPLTGFITAVLWKIFGRSLYVSSIFIFVCSLILIFNTFKLFSTLFPNKPFGLFILLPLLDTSFLTQLAIASPDILLITAFVTCLRAIVDDKKILLSVAYVFLCLVNARGFFAGVLVFAFFLFYKIIYSKEKITVKQFIRKILPFLPGIVLLFSFFAFYFSRRYWFFSDPGFHSNHYERPESLHQLIKNIAVYAFLLSENGKIFVWLFCLFLIVKFRRSVIKKAFTGREKSILFLFVSFLLMYFLLVILTQQGGLGSRYHMPSYFLLTVVVFILLDKVRIKRMYGCIFLLTLFLLSGNLWVYLYPEKLAKSWDTTLGHLPFYELREKCFEYMDAGNIPYEETSAGFCLYGNQRYIDLKPEYRYIYTADDMDKKEYFLYSDISNLSDEIIDELHDKSKWNLLKNFRKGPVFISIYKRVE
jgi:hypothetical protein